MSAELENFYLFQYVEEQHNCARSFAARHPDIFQVIDSGIAVIHSLSAIATVVSSTQSKSIWLGLMWQRVYFYQIQSIHSFLAAELDVGFALLRMACELTRDISYMARNPASILIWEDRFNDEKAEERYRKKFKFDKTSPLGNMAYGLYKFTSNVGVHGHRTTLAHTVPQVSDTSDISPVTYFQADENTPFAGIDIWLRSLLPLHGLCASALQVDDPKQFEPYLIFLDFIEALNPILQQLQQKK